MQTASTKCAHAKASHHALGTEQASLLVRDLLGRTILARRLGSETGISEFDVSTWPGGLYSATLVLDGLNAGTVKLNVQR